MKTIEIPVESPLHRRLVTKLQSRLSLAKKANSMRDKKWRDAEEQVLAYVPESEADAKRRVARDSDGTPAYTTLQIPYTYAMLMSAHTYWTSVFFARNPIHQFAGLHGESEMQVQALEALIQYQVDIGGMIGPYYIWLYDAGKYGVGILGHYWEKEILHVGQMVEMEDPTKPGELSLFQVTKEVVGYEGCRNYNVNPFDFLHDPRFPIGRFQEGEFVCVRKQFAWNTIIRRAAQGMYTNVDALRKGTSPHSYEGSAQLERPLTDVWIDEGDDEPKGGDKKKGHPSLVNGYEIYVDLIPAEWGLGDLKYPQKWVFTVMGEAEVIFGAQPLGLLHGKFPFDVLETEVEAYGMYNRGIPEIIEPVQDTMDWLLNAHFYNVRAALNNQFILDPSKIVAKDTEDGGPGFVFRLRPEAYGEDIRKFFMQVPVQDVTKQNVADLHLMTQLGERVMGINEQMMGSLAMGGRKTATEVRTSTGFGVNRMKTICEYMSAMGFAPHAQKLVQTSQQMYDSVKKLRIVGDLALYAPDPFLNVTPDMIAGNYSFVPVDGTLPVDRMAQANLWKEILMGIVKFPPLAAGFDITKIFAWMAQLGGLKNINQFRIQVLPPGAMPQGNVIPITAGRPGAAGPGAEGPGSSTESGLNALAPQ